MKQNNKRHIINRYNVLVICLVVLIVLPSTLVLTRTTIVQADLWNARAESLAKDNLPIKPVRGTIFADNGTILAANLTFYKACIDFATEGIKKDTLQKYLPALCDSLAAFRPDGKTAREWQDDINEQWQRREDKSRTTNRAYVLFRKVSYAEWQRLKTFPFLKGRPNHSGFYKDPHVYRSKPYGSMASRSIGNVTEDSTGMHGSSGLEMALDTLLYGRAGIAEHVQVTNGMTTWARVPALPGYDITTTINVALQDISEQALYDMCVESNAQWGTVVLMEVATGEIKAISNLEWNEKLGDYAEGVNHAVLGYEPGSVMKPISMMIALEDGLVSDIDAPIVTGRSVVYEGRAINDPHGGAALSPRQIIETSSNIGMSKIITGGFSRDRGYAARPGAFHDRLEQMGFLEPLHSGIAGERTPVIPRLGHTKADRVALTRVSYGYSTLLPPLCTLAMYNAIANNGHYVRPRLVKKLSRPGQRDSIVPVQYIRERVCDSVNAAKLRIMLHDVVWGAHGTARNFVKDDLVEIAGKTGTCYTTEEGHYTSVKRLAFCGFFPYNQPKYSCIVLMLGANRGAAASSGWVLRQIARRMYAHGLLGTGKSDDPENGPDNTPEPTLYASAERGYAEPMLKELGIGKKKMFHTPKNANTRGGVPNVKGLAPRQAIACLEETGLQAVISGTGYVAAQSLPPGAAYRRGQRILLTLRH